MVGSWKNVWWEVFDAPEFDGQPSDFHVVADDATAKRRFLERMTLFIAELRRYWRLLGTQWTPGQADTLAPLMAR